jgi:hypothetical protein
MPLACCAHAFDTSRRKLANTRTLLLARLVRPLKIVIISSFE